MSAAPVLSPLPPPHPAPHGPTGWSVPAGACDAHCHIFGPTARFPLSADRNYQPPETPLERYEQLARALGLSRAVFVQPAVYGGDHAAIIDALRRGEGRYAGVGIVAPDISNPALEQLHASGFRGARFNYVGHLGGRPSRDHVKAVMDRVGPLGWHLVFHLDAGSLADEAEFLSAMNCPVVIDHMARLDASSGVEQPGFAALLRLAALPHVWCKISAGDRMTGQRNLATAVPFMAALAQAAPDRTLWGTDWPHPNSRWMPDDGDLIDLLAQAVPDEGRRAAILVDNPARLYSFD